MALPPPISRLQDLRDRATGALTANQAIVWNGTAWTTSLLPIAGVSGLQSALDGKQAAGSYAAASHTHTASQVSDSTAAGRAILTAADVAAQRSALGLATVATSGSASDLSTGTLPAARLPIAAAGSLGGVRVGSGLSIDGSGVLSAPGLSAGTTSGNTLRWNGSAWVEASNLSNDGSTVQVNQAATTTTAMRVRGIVSASTGTDMFAVESSAGSSMFAVRPRDAAEPTIRVAGSDFLVAISGTWRIESRPLTCAAGLQFGDFVTLKNTGGGGMPYFAINCRTSGQLGPVVLGADTPNADTTNIDLIDVAKRTVFRSGIQLIQGLPSSAPTDADIKNNCMAAWLDNGTNTLTFRIRKNDGTYITKTL